MQKEKMNSLSMVIIGKNCMVKLKKNGAKFSSVDRDTNKIKGVI